MSKFKMKLQGEPVIMYFVVSPDNKKQREDYISSFVDLINNNKQYISKLIIVDGSYLNRHYYSEKDSGYRDYNDGTIFAWRNIHMSRLINLKVNYSIKGWHEIIEQKDFVQYRDTIEDLMQNKDFSDIAYMVAEIHKRKSNGNVGVCLEYLKEECAFILSLKNCTLTYPGKLNDAILWLLNNNYNNDIQFVEYEAIKPKSLIKNSPIQKNTEENTLAENLMYMKYALENLTKLQNSLVEESSRKALVEESSRKAIFNFGYFYSAINIQSNEYVNSNAKGMII